MRPAGAGYLGTVKVWAHIIATLVGLALAALIVYLVFGNASQQGATQDGAAPSSVASGESLCGTVTPAEGQSPAARATALEHPPTIIDATGREVVVRATAKAAQQRSWFARVHAASGLCLDEINVPNANTGTTTIGMSTVKSVSPEDAAAFAGGAIAASFTAPLRRPAVSLVVLVGREQRSVFVTQRAWSAFLVAGRSRGLGTSVRDLVAFRRSSGFTARDLRITGAW